MDFSFSPDHIQKLKETLLFAVIFTSLSGVLHFAIWLNFNTVGLQHLTAQTTSYILNWFGIPAQTSGIDIIVQNFGIVRIIRECLGWKSILAFTALVIATRKRSLDFKIKGILFGSATIIILNFVRLVSTFLLVYFLGWNFEIVHTVLWQWSLVVVVLLMWISWIKITG